MDITIARLHSLTRQVARLADATERLASVAENAALFYFGYVPSPKVKLTEEERQVEVAYTNETEDLVREMRERMGARHHDESDDDVL
jgi:hypothetical protein